MIDLEARVATLISDYQLALNKGSDDGVQVGQTVILWDEIAIADPETKESLGSVWVQKGELLIERVESKFSIASTVQPRRRDFFNINIASVFTDDTPRPKLRAPTRPKFASDVFDVKVGERVTVRIPEIEVLDGDEVIVEDDAVSENEIDPNEAGR